MNFQSPRDMNIEAFRSMHMGKITSSPMNMKNRDGVDLPAWMTSGEGSVGHFYPNSLAFSMKGPTTVASILGFVGRTVQENQRHGHSLDQDPRPGRSKSFHLTDLSDDIIDLFCNDSNIDSESLEPIPLFPTTSEVNIQAETTFPTLSLSSSSSPPPLPSSLKGAGPAVPGSARPAAPVLRLPRDPRHRHAGTVQCSIV